MRVQIGDKFYDSVEEPIAIHLTQDELLEVKQLTSRTYCAYPEHQGWEDNDYHKLKEWLRVKEIGQVFPSKQLGP